MHDKPQAPSDLGYDPYDYNIDQDPYKVWKRLRDEAPLYYNEQYDFYALSRYKDVHQGLEDWETYSSARGTVLEMMNMGELDDTGFYGDANLGMMIFSDPPNHDIARRLVNHNFTPKAVVVYEERVRYLANHFLDQVEGKAEFDVVDEIIRPIPPMMIGHILGVPEEDQEHLGRLVDESLAYNPDADIDERKESVMQGNVGFSEVGQYLGKLVADRTANPRDDMITMLVNADVETADGGKRRLDIREVISFFMLLQGAGSETTARALGWAGVLLARNPEQRKKLVDDPSKIRGAVEEVIRYEAPSPIQARYVMKDVEWYGYTVPKGSKIALINGSANRDDRQFDNPDDFIVDRPNNRHLSLGFGTHVCLGANLARLEMRVVIEEFLKRYPEWHVDESRVKLVHTTTVRGPASVPVQVG